ncbi:MAG: hypothetical protein AB7T49_08530 [Oligoflexales bacterium]
MRFIYKLTLYLLVCFTGFEAAAQEIPEGFVTVRPNAMGGAFTAIANDENAIWTNPAGIARIRKARSRSAVHSVRFPNLIVGANTSGQTFYKALQENGDESADTLSENSDKLSENPLWAVTSAFPMMMLELGSMPAATGAFTHTTIKAVVDKESSDQADTQIISDTGGVATLAFTNKTNRFNVGLQLRYVGRYAYEDTVPLATLSDRQALQAEFKENANRSAALAADFGLMWTLADFWFPTIGVAVLNLPQGCRDNYLNPYSKLRETICGTVFTGSFGNEDALSTVDPTDIRFGVSITPRIHRKLAIRIGLDMHHFHFASGDANYGYSDIPMLKRTHVGVELVFGNPILPSPFSISMGANQGFYTMGASLRLPYFSLDFASFGKDVSNTDSPEEDRRLLGGISAIF